MTLRPCLDCGEPADGPRCDGHRRARERTRATHLLAGNATRWKHLSARVRRAQPWCSTCFTGEDLTADHIIPVSERPDLAYRLENLDVLCRPCNGRKAGRPPTNVQRRDVLARLPERLRTVDKSVDNLGGSPSPATSPSPPKVKSRSLSAGAPEDLPHESEYQA